MVEEGEGEGGLLPPLKFWGGVLGYKVSEISKQGFYFLGYGIFLKSWVSFPENQKSCWKTHYNHFL